MKNRQNNQNSIWLKISFSIFTAIVAMVLVWWVMKSVFKLQETSDLLALGQIAIEIILIPLATVGFFFALQEFQEGKKGPRLILTWDKTSLNDVLDNGVSGKEYPIYIANVGEKPAHSFKVQMTYDPTDHSEKLLLKKNKNWLKMDPNIRPWINYYHNPNQGNLTFFPGDIPKFLGFAKIEDTNTKTEYSIEYSIQCDNKDIYYDELTICIP